MKSKTTFKEIARLVMCSMIIAMFMAVLTPVWAEDVLYENLPRVKYQKNIGISCSDSVLATIVEMGTKAKNAKKVTVTSSKKSIVTTGVSKDLSAITLFANKPGKSVVKVKVAYKNGKTRTYPMNVTVYKYINPVKIFKVAGMSFSFAKTDRIELKTENDISKYRFLVDDVIKGKITIKPKAGWKLKAIYTDVEHPSKKTKNGSKVTIKGTDYNYFLAEFYHSGKKLKEFISLDIDAWIDTMYEEE